MRFRTMLKEKRLILKRFGAGDRDRLAGSAWEFSIDGGSFLLPQRTNGLPFWKTLWHLCLFISIIYRIVAFNIVSFKRKNDGNSPTRVL